MQQHEHYPEKRKYFWLYTIGVFVLATLGLVLFTTRGGSRDLGQQDRPAPSLTAADLPAPQGSSTTVPGQPIPGAGIVPGRKEDTDGTRPPTQ